MPLDIILPVISESEVRFVIDLGREFSRRGFRPVFVPENETVRRWTSKRSNFGQVSTVYLNSLEAESETEETISNESLSRKDIFPQIVYDNEDAILPGKLPSLNADLSKYFKKYKRSMFAWVKILDDLENPVIIQHQGAEIIRKSLQYVAEEKSVPIIWVGFSPIEGHSSLYTDEKVNWPPFADDYTSTDTNYSSSAKDLIDEFVSTKKRIHHSSKLKPQKRAKDIFDKLVNEPEEVPRQAVKLSTNIITKLFRERYSYSKCLSIDESHKLIDSDKYVFFPIQYFRESRITVRAPAFYDQTWLIEYLSRSLPEGYSLVVKDHPEQLGALSQRDIKKISQCSSLVHPSINTHDIIRNSDAVVVINNTVGYESILHGKKVVTLGKPFYADEQVITPVDNINELGNAIHEAIKSDDLNEQEILRFTSKIIRGSYSGIWGIESDENIAILADSIQTFLNEEYENF